MKEVRRIRILKEMSMDEVYIKTKIPIPKLSRIERGIFEPSEKEKKLIARALKVPKSEIFPDA